MYILTNGTEILTFYKQNPDPWSMQAGTEYILTAEQSPEFCPFLENLMGDTWQITYTIDSGQYIGEDYNMVIYDLPFVMHWGYPESDVSILSSQLVDVNVNNCRILDFYNNMVVGADYTYTDYYFPDLPTAGGEGVSDCFGRVVYDHTGGYFTPNNELSPWNCNYKIKVKFSKPVSPIMIRKAVEYGSKMDIYSGNGWESYPYLGNDTQMQGINHFPDGKLNLTFLRIVQQNNEFY